MPCFHAISEHGLGQPVSRIGTAAPCAGESIGASHPNQGRALVEHHDDSARDAHGGAKNLDNPVFREDVDHFDAGKVVEFA